jgi:hypothetical protein
MTKKTKKKTEKITRPAKRVNKIKKEDVVVDTNLPDKIEVGQIMTGTIPKEEIKTHPLVTGREQEGIVRGNPATGQEQEGIVRGNPATGQEQNGIFRGGMYKGPRKTKEQKAKDDDAASALHCAGRF